MKEFLQHTKAVALNAIQLYFVPVKQLWFWVVILMFTAFLYSQGT